MILAFSNSYLKNSLFLLLPLKQLSSVGLHSHLRSNFLISGRISSSHYLICFQKMGFFFLPLSVMNSCLSALAFVPLAAFVSQDCDFSLTVHKLQPLRARGGQEEVFIRGFRCIVQCWLPAPNCESKNILTLRIQLALKQRGTKLNRTVSELFCLNIKPQDVSGTIPTAAPLSIRLLLSYSGD